MPPNPSGKAKRVGDPLGPVRGLLEQLSGADLAQQQAQAQANQLLQGASLERSNVLQAAQRGFVFDALEQMMAQAQAEEEAQEAAAQAEAGKPGFQVQVPKGSPLSQRPIASKNPLAQGNQQAFDAALIGAAQGQGAGNALQPGAQAAVAQGQSGVAGAGAVTQGLPVAGQDIQTQQSRLGISAQRESPFGLILTPEFQQTTSSQPNQLSAADIVQARVQEARLQQEQQQGEAAARAAAIRQEVEQKRLGLEERRVSATEGRNATLDAQGAARLKLDEARTKAYENFIGAKAQALAASKGVVLTPGEKAADQSYGRVYAQVNQAGGFAQAEKNLGVLEGIQKRLAAGENLSGGIMRTLPEGMRKQLGDQSAVDARQLVAGVVQQSAKQILGSQFTEKEAQAQVDRAFDPQLDPKFNATRLGDFVAQARAQLAESQKEAQYFEGNGTLKGFKRNVAPLSGKAGDQAGGGSDINALLEKYK